MTTAPRKLAALAVAGCAALALLTGCGTSFPDTGATNNRRVYEHQINLDDGRIVTCLVYGGRGLDCDWVNAR